MVSAEDISQGETADGQTAKDTSLAFPLSKRKLTWGVELEFVFAFPESQLELVPIPDFSAEGEIAHETITQSLPYHYRRDTEGFKNLIPWEQLPDRVYNSWGLYNEGRRTNKLQPYYREPHRVLRRLLEERCPSISADVADSVPINEKTKNMYSETEWLIMRDYSVCGVGSQNISTWLPRVLADSDIAWDSYGLELVSPIFDTGSNQGFTEIAQILEATKGKSSDERGAFITNQCGLHVHVQAPKNLNVLKELAALVIVYESEISKLHPHCRRPEHPNARYTVESNRLLFLHQDKEDETRHTYGDLDVSNAVLARQPENFLTNIREQINQCKNPQELALLMNWPNHGLGNELGNRSRQVNFTAAARPATAPYTIEFRQARGTLSAVDVQKWVEFCIGLVRLAQFYVDNPGKFPMKSFKSFSVGEDGEPVTERFYITELMRDMGLSEGDKEYWRIRIARFAGKGGPLDRLDNEWKPKDGEESEGIVGGGGNDDSGDGPGEGPSAGEGPGDNPGNGRSGGGNSGGNNNQGGPPSGNNASGRDSPPRSPPKGGKKPSPKTGKKRRAEDNEDEDQAGPNSKKQKKDTSKGNTDESTDAPAGTGNNPDGTGGNSAGEANPEKNNNGEEVSAKAKGKKRANDDDEHDNDEGQHASKKQRRNGQNERGGNEDRPQIPQNTVTRIVTTLANLFGSVIPAWALLAVASAGQALPAGPTLSAGQAPVADTAPFIPPDLLRPSLGMVAPVGIMSPNEAFVYRDENPFVWTVEGFHSRNWAANATGISIGQRNFVCSVIALRNSMRLQYPDSPYGDISEERLLALYDNLVGRRVYDDAEDNELADLMHAWTQREFRLVIVSDAYRNRFAYRAGSLEQQTTYARSLYVHWRRTGRGGAQHGHWESMSRRAAPRPDPPGRPGPSSSRPS